ncbi:MAG: hypothetical protein AB9846_03495 [Tenuifilaceae bacterium]
MNIRKHFTFTILIHLMFLSVAWSQQLAFPGAEGFGAYAQGGRGGKVLYVTNLNDKGEGSLRWAVEQEGPRTVVFAVSGTIDLRKRLNIKNPYITIAGQTAPGDGICLRGETMLIAASDVIIRFIRVRLGDSLHDKGSLQGKDAISIAEGENIIIDHCSASWSLDEILSASTKTPTLNNVTVQWCFITEGLNPDNHGYGSLIRGTGGAKYSFLNNLYANNKGRNPRPGNYDVNSHDKDPEGFLLDFRNNVLYNWGGGHAGYNNDKISITKLNYVNNYLVPGADSENNGIAYSTGSPFDKSYFSGNYFNENCPDNQWSLVNFRSNWTDEQIKTYKQTKPFETGPVKTDDAITAYERVLKTGGATLPKRDAVDIRIVKDVRNRSGKIIKSQEEVGGWPKLISAPAPIDSDNDGMTDEWENNNNLDKENPEDRNTIGSDGFTMLEIYLNSIVSLSNELIKIMPVGNSITAGEHYGYPALEERTGYRKTLYELLVRAGHMVDFVGSQNHGIRPRENKDWFDWNCEAYPGWKIPEISKKLEVALEKYRPNILLVHVGTNGKDWEEKPEQVQEMLDMVNQFSVVNQHQIMVFLCLIINRFQDEDPTPTSEFNRQLSLTVSARSDDKIRIILVDMEKGAGLDYSDNLPNLDSDPTYEGGDMIGRRYPAVEYDKYHPNEKGNNKMAQKFYLEMIKVLKPLNMD